MKLAKIQAALNGIFQDLESSIGEGGHLHSQPLLGITSAGMAIGVYFFLNC
jgi:hypothetical protein